MSEILGVLFAIFVGILVIPKFANYQKISSDNTLAAVTAQQQKQFIAAGTEYIEQNSVAIQAAATATTPAEITVAMLQAPTVNLLPTSFSSTNPYGQTWRIEVLQPSAGNLQALAMSSGGTAIRDAQAGKIAAIVGATGGLIPLNDSGVYPGAAANAYGAYAGWTVSTANYSSITGGHPAALLTFNNGQLASNYLYRNAVPGQPQLNEMNTPLIMNSIQVVGDACTRLGAVARASTGAVISCQGGVWKPQGSAFWEDPVASFAALPTCNAAAAWQTRVAQVPTVGTGPRAYTCTGTVWSPLAVNDSGDITIAGIATAGKVSLSDTAVQGAACVNPTGSVLVSKDAAGVVLSCQSGVWGKQSGGWKTLSLSDTAPFNPACQYLLDGAQATHVSAGGISVTYAGVTSTTLAVGSSNKTTQNVVQYNYSNYTDYGNSPVSSISYSCA